MELEQFTKGCDVLRCPRGVPTNHKCKSRAKRIRCFRQYKRSLGKYAKKTEQRATHAQLVEQQRSQAMLRDKSRCKIWAMMSQRDRDYVMETWPEDFNHPAMLRLSMMHIVPKSSSQKLKYDVNNVVMGREFFHKRLDAYRHPITNKRITKQHRLDIMRRARDFQV